MDVLKSISELRHWQLAEDARLERGFVPTMGALHEGHLSLIDLSKTHSDRTIVSIFVNPTQFGEGEDFEAYPRDLDRDLNLCAERGAVAVFCPSADDMYPSGATVTVEEQSLSSVLCGRSRPGHFAGVLTVVAKLFNLVQPQCAIFGEKDAQQLRLIQAMVRDLNFPITIIPAPIIRESDGLAKSSRNAYLSCEDRSLAAGIYASLKNCMDEYSRGEKDVSHLKGVLVEKLNARGLSDIDYAEIRDSRTLNEIKVVEDAALAAVAVHVGQTRLIDNVVLGGC